MALTATRVIPNSPELHKRGEPLFSEIWKVVGDGSDQAIDITPETFTTLDVVLGGTASVVIASNVATLTYATALGSTLIEYVEIIGRR